MEIPGYEDRLATDSVQAVVIHVENKLKLLTEFCQRRGYSNVIETLLRTDLEEEFEMLRQLPADSPLLEPTMLMDMHGTRNGGRFLITHADLDSPSLLQENTASAE